MSWFNQATGDFPHPFDTLAGRAVLTTFHSIAILLTLLRLAHRVRICRFSWDDGLALFALILMGLYMGEEWKRYQLIQKRDSIDPVIYYRTLHHIFKTLIAYAMSIIWLCRASLAFFHTRILPNGRRRTISMILSFACILYGTLLVTVKHFTCTGKESVTGRPILLTCKPFNNLPWILQTLGDILSSFLLLLLPLHALYRLSDLPKHERNLLVVLTSSTIIPLVTCLMHSVFAYQKQALKLAYTMKLMVSFSLSVCSLTIVVTAIYQVFRHQEDEDSEDSASELSNTSIPATQTNTTKAIPSSNFELTQIVTELSVVDSLPVDSPEYDPENGRR